MASHKKQQTMVCFCGRPCQSYQAKSTGETYLKCGAVLDYGAIRKKLDKYKNKSNRATKLARMRLGCNLNVKKSHYSQLYPTLFCTDFREFPKCHHDLFVRTGVSQSDRNKGRTFFSCPVSYPDMDCGYFHWFDGKMPEADEEESDTDSEEEDLLPPPPKIKQEKKKKKPKRKRKTPTGVKCAAEVSTEDDDDYDGGDDGDDEGPMPKRQLKMPGPDGLPPVGCLFNPDTLGWESA